MEVWNKALAKEFRGPSIFDRLAFDQDVKGMICFRQGRTTFILAFQVSSRAKDEIQRMESGVRGLRAGKT